MGKLISIGESVHASIPSHSKYMKELLDMGPNSLTKPSPQLDYVVNLIKSQVDDGADYIAINVDAFGENDPQISVNLMKEYVKLVRKHSKVPVCIDSSNNDVLIVGLKEWYNTDAKVTQPLVNSIKDHNIDLIMPLKKEYDYAFVGLLMSDQPGSGPGGFHTVDDLFNLAKLIWTAAMKYGFKNSEIFYDTSCFPIAIDMPMEPGKCGYTYRTFETIKKIDNDPQMHGVHFSLGITNSVRDLPHRKIGVARAFVQKAMEYGLDAGIVNPSHKFGEKPADQDLVDLVDAYAKLDGSMEALNDAMMKMAEYCQSGRK